MAKHGGEMDTIAMMVKYARLDGHDAADLRRRANSDDEVADGLERDRGFLTEQAINRSQRRHREVARRLRRAAAQL